MIATTNYTQPHESVGSCHTLKEQSVVPALLRQSDG